MKVFIATVIVIVVSAVIVGFFIIGSPTTARLRRFDDIRIQNLQQLQWRVLDYWRERKELPGDLEILRKEFSDVRTVVDPETGVDYGYAKAAENKFSLCVIFKTASDKDVGKRYKMPPPPRPVTIGPLGTEKEEFYVEEDSWDHQAGRACFERTIVKKAIQSSSYPQD